MKLSPGERSVRGRTSGLKKNEVLIAAKDGTGFIVGSTRKSTRISIGNSTTSVSHEEISSYSNTNSATTSGPDSGSGLSSISGSSSGS